MAYRSFGVILADIIQATKGTANSSGASPKYSLHLPLNRQSATYAREGIDLDVSTLGDWVGAAAATLMPLVTAILMHVFAGEGIHADDTTVPVLAKGKTFPSSLTRRAPYLPLLWVTGQQTPSGGSR
jgi:hypothetical protein